MSNSTNTTNETEVICITTYRVKVRGILQPEIYADLESARAATKGIPFGEFQIRERVSYAGR